MRTVGYSCGAKQVDTLLVMVIDLENYFILAPCSATKRIAPLRSFMVNNFSPSYREIYDVLYNHELNNLSKQKKIENILQDFWKTEFTKLINKHKSLDLTNNISLSLVVTRNTTNDGICM